MGIEVKFILHLLFVARLGLKSKANSLSPRFVDWPVFQSSFRGLLLSDVGIYSLAGCGY